MTCIVGLEEKGTVYIGGDSAGIAGLSISIRSDEKVFTNGPFIMGFTSSFRMGQLLQYKFSPPKQEAKQSDMAYMVTDFIDAVKKCFSENGFGGNGPEGSRGGTFLVGYNGHLYTVEGDYQVGKTKLNYDAVGCGADIALGSMYTSKGEPPVNRIKKALEAASEFSAGVAAPFLVLKMKA